MPLNKHLSKHNLISPTKQFFSILTILKKNLLPTFKNLDLKKVVAQHLQFQPAVRGAAEKVLSNVAAQGGRRNQGNSKLFYVGVHVRLVGRRQCLE